MSTMVTWLSLRGVEGTVTEIGGQIDSSARYPETSPIAVNN